MIFQQTVLFLKEFIYNRIESKREEYRSRGNWGEKCTIDIVTYESIRVNERNNILEQKRRRRKEKNKAKIKRG